MENAAMAAYQKDVESNNVDLTAEQILRDKLKRVEKVEPAENPNRMPLASQETNPRFNPHRRERDPADIDPCDTYAHVKRNSQSRGGPPGPTTSGGDTKGRSKQGRDKKKGKKPQEDHQSSLPRWKKLWYEARCPEGTYYWHTETNQSVWEPPEEGFVTIEEQEEDAKLEAIQNEFYGRIEMENAAEKAEVLTELEAQSKREKFRELKKRIAETSEKDGAAGQSLDGQARQGIQEEKEKIPYRRDYSVPEKPDPYGPWQTVREIPKKQVDLQLPTKKESIVVPTLQNNDPPPSKRVFNEKTVTRISTGYSDDESVPTTFKKRKIGTKNVRKRFDDD